MKISIITVVYNNEKTIKQAIESVISQTYKNIEYIIIDGASRDSTVDIISTYKDQITHFVSEKDNGIYDAMNKGILLATGDIIGILNSDDVYFDKFVIEKVMNNFIRNTALDIVYGNLVYVNSENINNISRKWNTKQYYNNFFEDGNVPPHPTLFIKRDIYKSIGAFNLNFKLAADYEFMLRIFKSNKFNSFHLDEILVKMRLGGTTNKNLSNIFKQNLEIIKAWKTNNLKLPILLMPMRIILRLSQYF